MGFKLQRWEDIWGKNMGIKYQKEWRTIWRSYSKKFGADMISPNFHQSLWLIVEPFNLTRKIWEQQRGIAIPQGWWVYSAVVCSCLGVVDFSHFLTYWTSQYFSFAQISLFLAMQVFPVCLVCWSSPHFRCVSRPTTPTRTSLQGKKSIVCNPSFSLQL